MQVLSGQETLGKEVPYGCLEVQRVRLDQRGEMQAPEVSGLQCKGHIYKGQVDQKIVKFFTKGGGQ